MAQNATKITRTQSKLDAIRSERLNFRVWRIEIFLNEIAAASRPCPPRTTQELPPACISGARTQRPKFWECESYGTLLPPDMPRTKKIRQITTNRKNKNLAIPAAAAAMPVNPKSAATSAIIRKIKAQRSIVSPPQRKSQQLTIARVF